MQAKHLLNKCPLIYGRPFTVADTTNISPKSFLSVRKYNGNGLKYAVDPYYFSEDDCLFFPLDFVVIFFLIYFELISINIPLATKSHAKTHSLSLTHIHIYLLYI